VHIALPYAVSRFQILAAAQSWGDLDDDDWRKRLWTFANHAETFYKLASLISFIVFIANGKYRSLGLYLLGIRLVYVQPEMARAISFDIMNRELVWQGFTEFLLFLLPLINLEGWRRSIIKYFSFDNNAATIAYNASQQHTKCVICQMDPIAVPYITDCGHIYCYYCISTNLMVDRAFPCPRCSRKIQTIQRAK
jgi:peroxin-2